MRLREILLSARARGRAAFIPFIMAGDPDMETSGQIILALQTAGAEALELGVPFSDPVADGVAVQRAHERALANGTTLKSVLALVKTLRERGLTIPVCLFSYLNPVYKMGYESFAKAAKDAGADGALIVDLPPEEAGEYLTAMQEQAMETVFLSSPTTSAERLKLIDTASTGFVYHVAREGVTGAQAALPPALEEKLGLLRRTLVSPVAVGFGISTREHVELLEKHADGVVVGSALVTVIAENNFFPRARAVEAVVRKMNSLLPPLPKGEEEENALLISSES